MSSCVLFSEKFAGHQQVEMSQPIGQSQTVKNNFVKSTTHKRKIVDQSGIQKFLPNQSRSKMKGAEKFSISKNGDKVSTHVRVGKSLKVETTRRIEENEKTKKIIEKGVGQIVNKAVVIRILR